MIMKKRHQLITCSISAILGLKLENVPQLKTPPIEIRMRGFKSTMAYLNRLLTGSVECKRTKLMMVGLGGAGKTRCVEFLSYVTWFVQTLKSPSKEKYLKNSKKKSPGVILEKME